MSFDHAIHDHSEARPSGLLRRVLDRRIVFFVIAPVFAASLAAVFLPRGDSQAATNNLYASSDDTVAPPDDNITIEVASVNGSGCRKGTAAVAMSPDNTAFTVTYSEYLAQVGVGAKPTDFRKNCQLNLNLNVPQGFTYAISQSDYRGYALLEEGANAKQGASYYFQGMSSTLSVSHPIDGPYDGNWQTTDKVGIAALVFAPCGEQRLLNINTDLRVDAGTSDTETTTSFVAMDSTDTAINTVYRLTWKKCEE